MILAVFPELLSDGGVQRVGQDVAAVIQELAENQQQSCLMFSLNDPAGQHRIRVADRDLEVTGFARNHSRFILRALQAALKSRLLYIAHPNLAPIGLICRWLNPKLKYVVTGHGWDVWNRLPRLNRIALRRADALTAVSQFTANEMMRVQGVEETKIRVIPNAVAKKFMTSNGFKTSSEHESPFLLTVGRLDARERCKGIDEVLVATAELAEAFPDLRYIVVGNGDDRPRLERLAKELGISDRVSFKGTVTDDELMKLYRSCDIFVMPSSQEGFGIVFLEAMAFRKPVIGGNYGGTPEIIVDNQTGFVVDYKDVESLKKRIQALLVDPELRQRMGDAGRTRLEENYTFQALRTRFLSVFNQVSASS